MERKHGINLPQGKQERGDALLALMLDANVAAVNHRYNEQEAPRTLTWDGKARPMTTKMKAHKTMSCWLYQCGEGDIDERPICRLIEDIKNSIANSLVNSMPGYAAIPWS